MRDQVVTLGNDELAVAARRDVGAVLDVAIRPVAFGGRVVSLVELRVEGFENERLVLFGVGLGHGRSPLFPGGYAKRSPAQGR
jgi:hypothetical protein